MSKADIAEYERLYNTRQRVSGRAGKSAGSTAYGPQIADLKREVQRLRKDVRDSADRNADRVTKGVNGAAAAGHRRGRA